MTDKKLAELLHKAADTEQSTAIALLLRLAADRIEELTDESV